MPGDGPFAGLASAMFRDTYLRRLTVLFILAAGLSTLLSIPRIEDPRIATRNALVTTVLPGASAVRVEAQVTEVLEDALKTLPEVKRIDSTSRAGLSLLSIELLASIDETSNEAAFSRIRDKLRETAPLLPPGADKPRFDDQRGAVAYGLVTAVVDTRSGAADLNLLDRAATELADRLRRLPGTELVRLHGAPEEAITVAVDPPRLAQIGLSAGAVSARIAGADARQVAGVYRGPRNALPLEVAGALDGAERVAAIPLGVAPDGTAITVRDVATVTRGTRQPPPELGFLNGQRAVFVAARPDVDVRLATWARAAIAEVKGFDGAFGPAVDARVVFDQSRYTAARLASLGTNLGAGALVVMAVVALLMGLGAALVVGSALPLSAAMAVFGIALSGEQLHQMSIFGMIVAVGLLIDNAIVMTDEVLTRRAAGASREAAIRGAVGLLSGPLAASTLTTILGFMPVFLLPGNVGDFVGPIAVSVVLALAASFVVALSLIPAFAARMPLAGAPGSGVWWRTGLSAPRLVAVYSRALTAALSVPRLSMLAIALAALSGFALAATLGNEFFPPAERNQFQVEVLLPSDAPVARTADVAAAIDRRLRAEPDVRQVAFEVGGSVPSVYYNQLMDEQRNARYAQAVVDTVSGESAEALVARLERELGAGHPDAQVVVSAFGQGPPTDAPIGFRLVGPDLHLLTELGHAVRLAMHGVPAVISSRASLEAGEPKLWFDADEHAVVRTGLTLSDTALQLYATLEGVAAGSVFEDLTELPVHVRSDAPVRGSLEAIASLDLVTPVGRVPALSLGDFALRPEFAQITRRDGERINRIDGFVESSALPLDAARAVRERISATGLTLPPGYRLEVAGDSEGQAEAVAALTTYLPLIALMMAATVVMTFRSLTLAAVVGTVALMSVGFGMAALAVSGYPLGFNPLIGTAGLVGVAINGSIVVLANLRGDAAARAGDIDAIVRTVLGSGRHIVATTLTTVGGFGPLVVFVGGAFWPPLAIVIAGGVACSLMLSLIFTPCAFRLTVRRRAADGPARSLAGLPT